MIKWIVLSFLLPLQLSAQKVLEGELVEYKGATQYIVIEENNDYAVTFCPENFKANFIVASFIGNEIGTFNFKSDFYLIKHELPSMMESDFHFEGVKGASIVGYRVIEDLFVVVSKFSKNQIEKYYLDVINLETMKKLVTHKEVIRFKTGEQNVCVHFKKRSSTTYEFLLKRVSIPKVGECFQYFILNKDFKVINYQKIPISSEFYNSKLSASTASESTKLVLTISVDGKETNKRQSVYGVFDILPTSFQFKTINGATEALIIDSKVLGSDNSNLIISVIKSDYSRFVDTYSVLDLASGEVNMFSFSPEILEQIKFLNQGYFKKYNKVKIKKISDYIFSAESFQDYYQDGVGLVRIYGPLLLFKVSETGDFLWGKIFSRATNFEKNLVSEVLWVDYDDNLYLLANFGNRGVSVLQINKENSNTSVLNKIEVTKMKRAFINSSIIQTIKNRRFFYVHGLKSRNIRSGSILSGSKNMPILIKF